MQVRRRAWSVSCQEVTLRQPKGACISPPAGTCPFPRQRFRRTAAVMYARVSSGLPATWHVHGLPDELICGPDRARKRELATASQPPPFPPPPLAVPGGATAAGPPSTLAQLADRAVCLRRDYRDRLHIVPLVAVSAPGERHVGAAPHGGRRKCLSARLALSGQHHVHMLTPHGMAHERLSAARNCR